MACSVCGLESCSCTLFSSRYLPRSVKPYSGVFPLMLFQNTENNQTLPLYKFVGSPVDKVKALLSSNQSGQPEVGGSAFPKGLVTFAFLGSLLTYSTWADRNNVKTYRKGDFYIKYLQGLLGSFVSNGKIHMPDGVYVPKYPYLFTLFESFKMGLSPVPMPVPYLTPVSRLFASSEEFRSFVRMGFFLATSNKEQMEKLNGMLGNTFRGKQIVASTVSARNRLIATSVVGFGTGSWLNGFVLAKLGIFDMNMLAVQCAWDGALILNMMAKVVGSSVTEIQKRDPQLQRQVLNYVIETNKRTFQRALPGGLVAMSLISGLGVPYLLKHFFSEDDEKKL